MASTKIKCLEEFSAAQNEYDTPPGWATGDKYIEYYYFHKNNTSVADRNKIGLCLNRYRSSGGLFKLFNINSSYFNVYNWAAIAYSEQPRHELRQIMNRAHLYV